MSGAATVVGPGSVKVPGSLLVARIVEGRLTRLHASATPESGMSDMPVSIRVQVCECGYSQFVQLSEDSSGLTPIVDDFNFRSARLHWRVCGHIPWCDAGHYSED